MNKSYTDRLIVLSRELLQASQPLRKSSLIPNGTDILISKIDQVVGYISALETQEKKQ